VIGDKSLEDPLGGMTLLARLLLELPSHALPLH
jgi:hypothetical protein